jgi:hypothetical protein
MAAEHGIQHLLYDRRHAIGARAIINIPAPPIVPHAIRLQVAGSLYTQNCMSGLLEASGGVCI